MAVAQAAPITAGVSFFSHAPTGWENLTPAQKDSCIGIQLRRQIEGHFAWAAAGALLEQWNQQGLDEYSAVIAHAKVGRFRLFRPYNIPGHDIRLLSTSYARDTATPFIVIKSKDKDGKVATETINRLEKHPRLAKFGFKYILQQGNTKLTMEAPFQQGNREFIFEGAFPLTPNPTDHGPGIPSRNSAYVSESESKAMPEESLKHNSRSFSHNLCGARIAVYSRADRPHDKKNVSTIGGVLKVGQRYYALTAAHVFFDNIDTSKSWADSGYYFPNESNMSTRQQAPKPHTSEQYAIKIESLWPHDRSISHGSGISVDAIGIVAPSLSRRRKTSITRDLPEVILDAELDWALIELRDSSLWKPNFIISPTEKIVNLRLPSSDIKPPTGDVIITSGVSGEVKGIGLGTIGTILLPWSSDEIRTWSVEGEIAIGDSGSFAISPSTGAVYGLVVAHDPDTLITYIVPILSVVETIKQRFEVESEVGFPAPAEPEPRFATIKGETNGDRSLISSIDVQNEPYAYSLFRSKLKSYTLLNYNGQPYVRTPRLITWLLSTEGHQVTHLDLLLNVAYSEHLLIPLEAGQISDPDTGCLLIFSLLLELGHGNLIHQFLRCRLSDRRLPFDANQLLEALPSQTDSQLIDDILSRQWKYCPLTFDLHMGRDVAPQCVVPIHERSQINLKGGSARVWQVAVAEDFVDAALRQEATVTKFGGMADTTDTQYKFAIKLFSSHEQDLFRAEREAFLAFQKNPAVVRCFGDFTYYEQEMKTYSIVMEYGEYDLDEFFANTSPPIFSSNIITFWEGLFQIAEAIREINLFDIARAGVVETFSGIHGDVKPDNILRVENCFKLTDVGFASFHRWKDLEPHIPLRGGTWTYGAPEVPSEVSDSIDIWSYGCVLSIAATWVIMGEDGISQYDSQRRHSTRVLHVGQTDCFHDGENVLKEVLEWHKLLRSAMRRTDLVTDKILDLVDACMLTKPETRIKAKELCERLKDIVALAKTDGDPSKSGLLSSDPTITNILSSYRRYNSKGTTIRPEETDDLHLTSKERDLRVPIQPDLKVPIQPAFLSWTVSEARDVLHKHLKGSRLRRPKAWKNDFLSGHLGLGRKMIFLVDNAETMSEYWDEATDLCETLVMMLSGQNVDTDLSFTTGTASLRHVASARKVRRIMQDESARPKKGVHTNMASALGEVLTRYLHDMIVSRTRAKHECVIVFTDGAWVGSRESLATRGMIVEFARKLFQLDEARLKTGPRFIGIQFVQFGSDPEAEHILRDLDDNLYIEEKIPDIIDTVPSTGSLFKMLLGSIVREIDNVE